MPGDHHPAEPRGPGFVIGELLLALLLLTVAVSSLAALMYSVSRRPEVRDAVPCVAKSVAAPGAKCVAKSSAGAGARVPGSDCLTKSGTAARTGCTAPFADSGGETIVKSRTDSASLAMVAKKQQPPRPTRRPDRGFIR